VADPLVHTTFVKIARGVVVGARPPAALMAKPSRRIALHQRRT